jgi:hypothetical protein
MAPKYVAQVKGKPFGFFPYTVEHDDIVLSSPAIPLRRRLLVTKANAVNEAGCIAYMFAPKHALA